MKKHLLIEWRGEDTTVKLENVTVVEVAAVLVAMATESDALGRALLVAAAKYEDLSKASGKLKIHKGDKG